VLLYKKKGPEMYIGTAEDKSLAESGCRFCGACAEVCPTGAIMDKEEFGKGKSRKAALVPCRSACPAEIDVPMYVRFIREKNFGAAVGVIREKVPFPHVLGYVCNRPCETVCRRGEINESVSIRNLKRCAAEYDEQRTWRVNMMKQAPTHRKVAVIGSGPAGMTAAYYLSILGHTVVVFEALPFAGGMLRYGIPEYRLPRHVIDAEIEELAQLGVEIRTGSMIESIDSLQQTADFDAILMAVGAHKGMMLPIPAVKGEGIHVGTEFMKSVNQGDPPKIGRRVMIIGGGNVALDCARVSLRTGAESVRVVCLEAENEMPAAREEIDDGRREGILLFTSRTCTCIIRQNGIVAGAEFLAVRSFSFDEDGNLEIETIEDSAHIIEADTIIFAVGQKPEVPVAAGLNMTPRGLVEFDPYTFETSVSSVFAAGDAATGPSSVIDAITSGRKAASAIDRFLDGSGRIEQKLAPSLVLKGYLGMNSAFAAMPRCDGRAPDPVDRTAAFCAETRCMDEQSAQYESGRCLQCDLRLTIKPVKFWMNYLSTFSVRLH
jgi:NADPH-dependent glutamate synthase beta subunit-like oxidoreductase